MMRFEGLAEEPQAAREVTIEDAQRTVRDVERAPFVVDVCTEMLGRVAILELADARLGFALEVKADHHVVEDAIHEVIDYRAHAAFAAEAREVGASSDGLGLGQGSRRRY